MRVFISHTDLIALISSAFFVDDTLVPHTRIYLNVSHIDLLITDLADNGRVSSIMFTDFSMSLGR